MTPTNPPTMTIDGMQYVEAPETFSCMGCALHCKQQCNSKTRAEAERQFGQSCADRCVIYIRAQPEQSEQSEAAGTEIDGMSDAAITVNLMRFAGLDKHAARVLRAGDPADARRCPRCPAHGVQWMPIETAPKDGTAIIVSDGCFVYCVEWNAEFDWWAVDDNKLGPFRLRGQAPTHWMPLPTAPTTEQEPQ